MKKALSPRQFMQQALALALSGKNTVSPNPMVGSIIVKNQEIVAQGIHVQAGSDHSEIAALKAAGDRSKDGTLYVTLEPCAHFGRTPPCTNAILKAGIKKVYVACIDPNPLVAGKGIAQLREGGCQVEVGLCEKEAQALNRIFFHFIRTKRPYVIAKWAMSLDGKTNVHPLDDKAISSAEAKIKVHELRESVDAILIGAETARLDNPQLTVRKNGESKTKHPLRLVLTTRGKLPLDLQLLQGNLPGETLVLTTDAISKKQQQSFETAGIEYYILPKNSFGQINLIALLDELGKRAVTSLMIEGGMNVLSQFFAEDLINEAEVYIAPTIIGTRKSKLAMHNVQMTKCAKDILITGNFYV